MNGVTEYLRLFAEAWRIVMRERCLRCGDSRALHCEGGPCNALADNGKPCRCLLFCDSWVNQTPHSHWREA